MKKPIDCHQCNEIEYGNMNDVCKLTKQDITYFADKRRPDCPLDQNIITVIQDLEKLQNAYESNDE